MGNDWRVADELYIKRVLIVLEDFLFFTLYSCCCIAKQVSTLKQLRLLSCLDFLDTNLDRRVLFSDITLSYQYHLRQTPPVTSSSELSIGCIARDNPRGNGAAFGGCTLAFGECITTL